MKALVLALIALVCAGTAGAEVIDLNLSIAEIDAAAVDASVFVTPTGGGVAFNEAFAPGGAGP